VSSRDRVVSTKPNVLKEIGRFPNKQQAQIWAKVTNLLASPEPDGKVRKRLKGAKDGLCRLRSGDYRIFYTYDYVSVSLYSVRIRDDDTFDSMPDVVELEHGSFDEPSTPSSPSQDFQKWVAPVDKATPLPEPIGEDLLNALDVPRAYHARLVQVDSQEGLLSCPGVPDEFLLALDQHMFIKPFELVAEEPTLIVPGGVDDLIRFTEGKLVTFLLKLDPEQEHHVVWSDEATGPTLLKGGPGTGKSTVALYRVREMLRHLRESGVEEPNVLFATYTRALITFSKQLLEALLGDDFKFVDVRTADSLVGRVLGKAGGGSRRPNASERSMLQKMAWDEVQLDGNAVQAEAQHEALNRLGSRYVFEEIAVVVQGRDVTNAQAYLEMERPGRRVDPGPAGRRAIWAVSEAYQGVLDREGYTTWQQARAQAAQLVASGESSLRSYDAVVVDEAQDLDFNSLRLLVEVCAQPNRLFLTADESQSIHSAGFGWKDVHKWLDFDGDVPVLGMNHRSTRQLIEAARDYLAAGLPDDLAPDNQQYRHDGPYPTVRAVTDQEAEADLVARSHPEREYLDR